MIFVLELIIVPRNDEILQKINSIGFDVSCIQRWIQEKIWSHISNSWRKTCVNQDKIPPSKFRLIYEAIVKEKKNVSVGYYGFNLTIFSSLLSYDIFYIQPLIHIISYPLFLCSNFFSKSLYTYHIFVTVTYLRF